MRTEISTVDELRDVIGRPLDRVIEKERTSLTPEHLAWLGASPFCLVATSAADGSCDVSPKGDPKGLVHVIDDRKIVIPERPGNKRADGYENILANPHVGLLFMVPGRGDTLRINGKASLVSEAPYFDEMIVKGNRPILAVEVAIEQIFFHCAKAFLRSSLWKPETWNPDDIPSRVQIAKSLERPQDSIEELEKYYGEAYSKGLY